MEVNLISEQMQQLVEVYNKGLDLYKDRKFTEALKYFKKALEIAPDDGPSHMYEKRCKEFIENPPPPDWDGVYIMKTK
jgi:tetratricopeptide (TPR) repeat protein